jgi:hypothetical protein
VRGAADYLFIRPAPSSFFADKGFTTRREDVLNAVHGGDSAMIERRANGGAKPHHCLLVHAASSRGSIGAAAVSRLIRVRLKSVAGTCYLGDSGVTTAGYP